MSDAVQAGKPSETRDGREFIARFVEVEQPVARLLIDSLEIHNFSHILNSLREELLRSVGLRESEPAVLIPIRSHEDLPDISKGSEHIAYKTFQPGSGFSSTPGSEGEIGSVVASLVEGDPDRFLAPTTSLEDIREGNVRSIILLTDYCGSGTQALRFARSFTRNPRLASWISSGHLRLRVQSYASSKEAISLFSSESGIEFSTLVAAKSGPATNWTNAEAQSVTELCIKHASGSSLLPPLGYKESFGLYLSSYRVPNNLPQILIRSDGPWPGLFPARRMPAAFGNELTTYIPRTSVSQILRNLGESNLASFIDEAGRPVRVGRGLAAMSLLGSGNNEDVVRHLTGQDDASWKRLRSTLMALGLIDIDLALTALGRAELKRSRLWPVGACTSTRPVVMNSVEYYPTQLR